MPANPREPTLSVVLLTRHRPVMLARCLKSLFAQQPVPEVIVVDNSDDQATRELVTDKFPAARYFHRACTRFVLAEARNFGAAQASGDIIVFVDDDVTVYQGWSQACLQGFDHPTVGAVGGRILDPEVEHLDYYRPAPIGQILPDGRLTDNFECDPGEPIDVQHLRGCNLAVARSAFQRIGGFDTKAPIYRFEELDLCLRLTRAGYRIRFLPAMVQYHYLGNGVGLDARQSSWQTRRSNSKALMFIYTRNLFAGSFYKMARFMLATDSGILGLLRHPSRQALLYIFAGFAGKSAGLLAYWRIRK